MSLSIYIGRDVAKAKMTAAKASTLDDKATKFVHLNDPGGQCPASTQNYSI